MDGIESAIRGALARGDATDKDYRERVYRSVFTALERRLSESPGLPEGEARRRRDLLKQHIVAIEREHMAASPPAAQAPRVEPRAQAPASPAPTSPAPRVVAPPPAGAAPGTGSAPPVMAVDRRSEPSRAAAPELRAERPAAYPGEGGDGMAIRPRRDVETSEMVLPGVAGDMRGADGEYDAGERRRPWGLLLALAALVAILGAGAWFVLGGGLSGGTGQAPAEVADDVTAPPAGPPPLNADQPAEREWTTVFSASDPSRIGAASGATVEPMQDEGEAFVRLRSSDSNAALRVAVDGAALAAVAGGPVVFDIVARAQEGQETQISVTCDFGVLGDCGRRRYVVGLHRADFLFDIELGAANAAADGIISIVTDVEGEGRAIDLFEIRLARAQ